MATLNVNFHNRFLEKSYFRSPQCPFLRCNHMRLTWVDKVSLRVQQGPQRLHVVKEILKDSRAFAQDAVS